VQDVSEQASVVSQMYMPEVYVEMPSFDEFMIAMRRLKKNKAPGVDGITTEMITSGGEDLACQLYELVLKVWQTESMPDEWKVAVLCPLHKKGDRLKCENFRGIALLCTAYKLFSLILLERIIPYAEEIIGDYQCGFRPNRSVTDQTFSLRMILSKCWEYNITVHQLFIDFKQAYDSLNRERLWFALEWLGVPKKLVSLCKLTVTDSRCCVKVEGRLSREFNVQSGVRQGDALSPILFSLALEYVFRLSKMPQDNILFDKSAQVLAYADDLCILGRSVAAVRELFIQLEPVAQEIGLVINESKTQYMSTTRKGVRRDLDCGESNFEGVTSFKYLGSLVTSDNDVTVDIKARLVAANKAFFAVRFLLKSKYLSRVTKVNLYKSVIRPVATFGCESWTLNNEDERLLGCFERKILRAIYGPIMMDNGEYRIRWNDEIRTLLKGPDIIGDIKSKRIRWLGHVLRTNEKRCVNKVNGRAPDGVRPQG
jgi:Reverse transcriptase (RNA-dependent DNA polymerase)